MGVAHGGSGAAHAGATDGLGRVGNFKRLCAEGSELHLRAVAALIFGGVESAISAGEQIDNCVVDVGLGEADANRGRDVGDGLWRQRGHLAKDAVADGGDIECGRARKHDEELIAANASAGVEGAQLV